MNTKNNNRILSLILCVIILIGLTPIPMFAANGTPITTDKVYTYQRIDSVEDIVPGKHFIIVAEYTNETTGATSYHALGAKMAFYDGFRQAYRQDNDDYYGIGKTFEISDDKKSITTYYNDTNYEHNYKNDYSVNEPEYGILRLRFEAYDLSKHQYRFAVDGHGYMYGFSSRGNDGTAGHDYHAKMPIGTSTSGAPWWQLSVGQNGYWQICTQTTYGSYDGRITGYERIQSYIYPHHGIAATEVYATTGIGVEYIPEGTTGILLFMESECNHYIDTITYTPGKDASCSGPGVKENWYCSDCETYFSDEAMTETMEPREIFLDAPAHTDTCGHTNEEAKFELCIDPPNGSNQSGERYLLIGKDGDKYYAMGNVTNADGSRNAVEVICGENGIIEASSHQAEFLTYYWPDNGAIGYLADNGYFTVDDGRIIAYDQSLCDTNKYIPDPVEFRVSDYETGVGCFNAYSLLDKDEEYIVFDRATLSFKGQSEAFDSTYLYRELCPHEKEYTPGIEATCTRCGSAEFWYCDTCYKHFGAADGSITLEEQELRIHASGHDYQDGFCLNCGKKVPVYTKVTSEEQFGLPGTYIVVATDGTNTYVLQAPTDEWADVYANDYDESLVIPVTPDADGNISVLGLDAAEFEMIKCNNYGDYEEIPMAVDAEGDFANTDSEKYYFWMFDGLLNGLNEPNTRFACYMNGEEFMGGDETSVWGVSLGEGITDLERQQLEKAQFVINDDTAILYAENCGNGATCALRLRLYNGVFDFITEYDAWLPGATEKLDANGDPVTDSYGNTVYDTNDTQYGVYLYYASEEYTHIHEWSDWTPNADDTTHFRTCSVDGCTVMQETKNHSWGDGVETKGPTCTEEGVKTFTCSDCGATKTKSIDVLEHDWSGWIDDGENATADTHTRSCQRANCNEIEQLVHSWGAWMFDDDSNHKKTCSVCSGTRTDVHKWDDGVITTQPTEDAEGVRTYTCTVCNYIKTEPIEKLEHVHEWSDWTGNNDGRTHSHECDCGESETFDHSWSTWVEKSAGDYERVCTECKASEVMVLNEEKPVNATISNSIANTNLINTDIELIDRVLTDEEQSQVAEGTEVKIYLKVEDISNETPAEHKDEAEAKAGNDEIGMYLDIDLFKQIGNATEIPVTETDGTVRITITIPDNLINTDASITRTYKIIRVHEDVNGNLITDVIEGIFNPTDNSFTFETDKFSTYALAYADTSVSNTPGGSQNDENDNVLEENEYEEQVGSVINNASISPKTGDNSMILLWTILMFISSLVVVAANGYGRKRTSVK